MTNAQIGSGRCSNTKHDHAACTTANYYAMCDHANRRYLKSKPDPADLSWNGSIALEDALNAGELLIQSATCNVCSCNVCSCNVCS